MKAIEVHIGDGEYRVGASRMGKTQFIVSKLISNGIPAYAGMQERILVTYGQLTSKQHPQFPLATVYEWTNP